MAGSTVPVSETVEAFKRIVDGDYDHLPEQAFFNIGDGRTSLYSARLIIIL